jgi:hypothetical protein
MYLIIAMNEDLHADAVLYCLEEAGETVVRIDPARLFIRYGVSPDLDLINTESQKAVTVITPNSAVIHLANGKSVDVNQVEGVFCRSFYVPTAGDRDSTADHLAMAEIKSVFRGFCSMLPPDVRWVNDPYIEDRVDNKIFQHYSAQRFGLQLPDTLVTNDSEQAKEFFKRHKSGVIIKQLSDISLVEEKPIKTEFGEDDMEVNGFYTSEVTDNDIGEIDEYLNPGSAPILLQEKLLKRSELRVTVVGDKVFTYRLFSQENEKTMVDFRKDIDIRSEKAVLPAAEEKKLLAMLKFWGISFAACDFVETQDGRTVFLEANVEGNWLWLEEERSPIAKSISNLLRGK